MSVATVVPKKTTFPIDLGKMLLKNAEGKARPLLANALTMLKHHPDFEGVAFDQFSLRVIARSAVPEICEAGAVWGDYHDSKTAAWLQHKGVLVNSKVAAEAIQTIAKENAFHPVQQYLKALRWDGVTRIDTWLSRYLGCASSPFTSAVGARWLISACARAMNPGCQVDHVLLLEGPQGYGKSSALRELAGPEWFADHTSELGSKDSRVELAGKWIVEMAELDSVRRGKLESVKSFLTARSDHFRPPYGRRAEDVPRSCVFAGSTNSDHSLADETGNRRFWPVLCEVIDVPAIRRDRDLLWAEAYQRYASGAAWWPDTEELQNAAKHEQEQRYDAGVWDDIILAWVDQPSQRGTLEPFDSTRDEVTITDILLHGIGKDLDRCTQVDRNAVARCLIHDGWTCRQVGSGKQRGKRFYFRHTVLK